MKVYQYKPLHFELKADAIGANGIVEGYLSAFNIEDSMGDTMKPGAFAKTIMEQGPNASRPRIKYLLNHDVSLPVGKFIELAEDNYGLKYKAQLGTNAAAVDFRNMIESGLITEHSIGYQVIKSIDDKETYKREILEVKLYEGSALSGWGVNQHTPLLSLKAEEAEEMLQKRLNRIETFVRKSNLTDEISDLLLLEIRQLNQNIIDLKSATTKPLVSTSPGTDAGWMNMANILLSNPLNF